MLNEPDPMPRKLSNDMVSTMATSRRHGRHTVMVTKTILWESRRTVHFTRHVNMVLKTQIAGRTFKAPITVKFSHALWAHCSRYALG